MIIHTNALNQTELTKLEELRLLCKKNDGHVIPIYPHLLCESRSSPANFLYYQQEQLVGFLSVYFFYEKACEISLMIAPAARRKHLATQMLLEVVPCLAISSIESVTFSTAHLLYNPWLSANEFRYLNSEYQLERFSHELLEDKGKKLHISAATLADLNSLCLIDEKCFPPPESKMAERFKYLLNDSNYSLFIAKYDDEIIGKAHIHWRKEGAFLTDIAVLPKAQGKGFGRSLVSFCVNHVLNANRKAIYLDVETNNQEALKLYTSLGFTIQNIHDYWTIPYADLHEIVLEYNGI